MDKSGIMGRKLKYHEQRLLKKTNLLQWKRESNVHIGDIMAKYALEAPHEYYQYSKLVGQITHLTNELRQMDAGDKVRIDTTRALVDRLYKLGVIDTKDLSVCENISVSSICRRRLPVVMVQLKFCSRVEDADKFVRQGHVRVGPGVVTNPSMLVSREMQDFISWARGSKIQQHVAQYREDFDDFDINN